MKPWHWTRRPVAGAAGGTPGLAGSVSRSHVGRVRAINEDRVFDGADHGVWAVADGMGGHHGGDLAAQAVVDTLRGLAAGEAPVEASALLAALAQANRAIVARNTAAGGDAGSTVVALHATAGTATIAWAGDSRAYLVRDAALACLTRDHSVVQELVDAGLLTPRAAHDHPRANVVTRALGIADPVAVETTRLTLRGGDRLLLCSDGISRSLDPADALAPLAPDALADRLLAAALARDGSDNASLVLIDFA